MGNPCSSSGDRAAPSGRRSPSAIGGLALFAPDGPAQAQNAIVETSPADGSEVTTQPAAIVMTFENEVPDQRDVQVVCEGNPFSSIAAPELGDDGVTLTVDLLQAAPGRRVQRDVDAVQRRRLDRSRRVLLHGERVGRRAPRPAATTTTVAGATTTAVSDADGDNDDVRDAGSVSSAPIWLGRVLSIIGIAVVFGSLVLIVAAWPEGPEYVLALRFLRSMWIVGLVGTLIYVAGLSAAVKGESFSSGLNPASWFDLFDAGWPGRFAVLRVVLVIAMAWVVMKPERVIDPTTNMLALGIPALAVVTLGLSRTGGNLAFLGVVASILHVLAMAVWFGGAVLLARVVLAGPGDEDLVHAVRGFSRISNPAIVITLFSGLIQLYRLDGGELFSSGHGRVVLLKTVAVAAMVFVGMTAPPDRQRQAQPGQRAERAQRRPAAPGVRHGGGDRPARHRPVRLAARPRPRQAARQRRRLRHRGALPGPGPRLRRRGADESRAASGSTSSRSSSMLRRPVCPICS